MNDFTLRGSSVVFRRGQATSTRGNYRVARRRVWQGCKGGGRRVDWVGFARVGATELMLIRHGQSTGNVAREQAERAGADVMAVDYRDADVPLTDLGRAQAQALGRWLDTVAPAEAPTSVWSSPYLRARDTAAQVLQACEHLPPMHIDERLRDKELGILDGLTFTGMRTRFPQEAQRRERQGKFYYRPPGGESWADMALRVRSVLLDIDRIEDGRVAIFTHDAIVFLFRYVCQNLDEPTLLELGRATLIANASVTRLVRTTADGPWTVAEFNDTAHLRGL